MTSELQQNRYDRLIRRVGGIIGVGSKVSEVLTELFPMIDVENDRGELQLLAGINIGMGTGSKIGDANESSRVQLFNPTDSGTIITVTEIFVSSTVTQGIHIARSSIELSAGIGTELPRDTRRTVNQRLTGRISTESNAALADANMLVRVSSDRTLTIKSKNDVMVLSPGNGCTVGAASSATLIQIVFLWRERPAETSELNF